jgi:hypothetical protein
MKFLICPIPSDEVEFVDLRFTSPKGTHYSYEVAYEENEMITITDTLGRSVPMDISEVPALLKILTKIVTYQHEKENVDRVLLSFLARGSE